MKLKFNHDGTVHEIPLSTDKPQGKRFAIRYNGLTYYAPLVTADNPNASAIKVNFGGIVYALAATPAPQITDLTITPPTLAAMQGQSATATITALTNEQVAGLSYSLENSPTWITISDDVILIEPSDNDLGQAVVQVYARDTGSDASASAPFVAEALLRPIIESLYVIPPAVTVQQGHSATAGLSAVANAAVTGLNYSISGQSAWITLEDDTIYLAPTDNDLGDNTVNVVAYDVNSSASAATTFVATAAIIPTISDFTIAYWSGYSSEMDVGVGSYANLSAVGNAAVTSIQYSLLNPPPWCELINGNLILFYPTEQNVGSYTITAIAHDTGSDAQASLSFSVIVKKPKITGLNLYSHPWRGWPAASLPTSVSGTPTVEAEFRTTLEGFPSNIIYSVKGVPATIGTGRIDPPVTLAPTHLGSNPITLTATDPVTGAYLSTVSVLTAFKGFEMSGSKTVTLQTGTSGNVTISATTSIKAPVSVVGTTTPFIDAPKIPGATLSIGADTGKTVSGTAYTCTTYKMIYPKKQQTKGTKLGQINLTREDNDSYQAVNPGYYIIYMNSLTDDAAYGLVRYYRP